MKRDMDLVRKIVFALEEHSNGFSPGEIEFEGYTHEQVGHHIYLMIQAGLVEGLENSDGESNGIPQAEASCLTWGGHDFADDARSDTIWNKAKAQVRENVTTVGFGLLVEVLKYQAKRALGIP
jgi:hypothetical protein